MYFHKPQEKPQRWGNFQSIQYAVMKNCEKIYDVDPDSIVLAMPLFWGLPPLDYSGKNNHGTNHGATYKDKSLSFDGTNDYIESPSLATPNFTASVWYKWNINTDNEETLISNWDGSNRITIAIIPSAADNRTYFIPSNVYYERFNGLSYQDEQFHHFLFTWDGSNLIFYFDGIDQGAPDATGDPSDNTQNAFRIGASLRSSTDRFTGGLIDKTHIFDTVLIADQIALFHDRPWALYQPVSRPVYFFQAAAGLSIPVAIQNMRGGFNPIGIRGGFINAD